MNLRILAGVATIVVVTCFSPGRLQADGDRALLLDATYSKPLRWNFGGSLLFSNSFWDDIGAGIILGGSVGKHGVQLSGGKALLSNVGNVDLRAVVTRTWNDPRGASPNSTYVGGEVGWGLGWRLSVGYGKRVAGLSAGHDHLVTWGLGMEIPVLLRQRARGTGGTNTSSSARAANAAR